MFVAYSVGFVGGFTLGGELAVFGEFIRSKVAGFVGGAGEDGFGFASRGVAPFRQLV